MPRSGCQDSLDQAGQRNDARFKGSALGANISIQAELIPERTSMSQQLLNIQVEIPATDLERAKNFYIDVFSFVLKEEKRYSIEFDNNIILVQSEGKKDPQPLSEKGILLNFWVDKINLIYKDLTDRGIAIESPPVEDKDRQYFYFRDSEGNINKVSQKL